MKKSLKFTLIIMLAMLAVVMLSLVACNSNRRHTVTFQADGKVVDVVEFTEGKKIKEPAVPQKEHYTGNWESYTLGKDDITVYAVYTPIEYTATFDDGTKQTAVTYTEETAGTVHTPRVTPKQYYNGYWQLYEFDFSNEQVIYAEYYPIIYRITFVGNGQRIERTYNVETIDQFVAPEVPEKEHYTGTWQDYELLLEKNQVVNAVYTPIDYKITFVGDGQSIERTYNAETIDQFVAPEVPEKEHYTGTWQEWELQFEDNQIVNAVYTPIEYTATFDDGTKQTAVTYTIETKDEVIAPEVSVKEHYTGVWQEYELQFDNDQVINAVYTPIDYKITFVGNGQRIERAYNAETTSQFVAPEVPVKEQYYGFDYVGAWERFNFEFDDNQEVNAVYTLNTPGYTYMLNKDQQSYSLTKVSNDIEEAHVLPYYNDLPVTSIGNNAFSQRISLQTVTFEGDSQLQSIGDNAFRNSGLSSITIPSTVTSIGEWAFDCCRYLQTITFEVDSQLQSIGGWAFYDCQLKNVYYGGTIESWCEIEFVYSDLGCFSTPMCCADHFFIKQGEDWQEVTELVIPEGVEKIGDYQFDGFEKITSVTIPSTVTSIGINAFRYCVNLQDLMFEDDSQLQSIGDNAFYGCSQLTNVYYGGTIESWCGIEFTSSTSNPMDYAEHIYMKQGNDWQEVMEIVIPEGVEKIGNYQFYNFCNITSIIIPSTVTSIGERAFYDCSGLTSITIPSAVTSIGNYSFFGCSQLTNVYYGGTIESWCGIEFTSSTSNPMDCVEHFFMKQGDDWQKVSGELKIPDGIEQIGDYQFYGFENITSITIPSTVTSIGNSAFYDCDNLQTVTLEGDSQLQSIGNSAFLDCRSLTSIIIPSTVTSIRERAFWGTNLQTVMFEGNSQLQSIGDGVFCGCTQLRNVYYGGTIESWCGITFGNSNANPMYWAEHFYMQQGDDWQEVTEIKIPEGVEEIGDFQFWGFENITSITIPGTVTSIGEYAFEDCSSLTSIVIPSKVISIGNYAFEDCSNLQMVTFEGDSQLKSIGDSAFYGCTQLRNVYYGGTIESWCGIEFVYKYYGWFSTPMYYADHFFMKQGEDWQEVTEIVIPEGVEEIGDYQFCGFENITSITIPITVTSIGNYAFHRCSQLTNVYYGGTIESWCGIEFKIYNDSYSIGYNPMYNSIHFFLKQDGDWQEVTEIKIPDGFEKIGDYQFCGFNVTLVTIPSNVTSIGNYAFDGCSNLQSVTFEGDSQLQSIGEWAFYHCRGLTSITIPSTVTSIGEYAFCGCTNLQTVTFESDSQLQSIGSRAFYNCSSLASIVIPNTVTSIESGAFEGCTNLQTVTFEGDSQLQSIGSDAFYICRSLISIVIPSTVTSIGNCAFDGCSNLQTVTFEGDSQLQSIGEEAFGYCSSLTSIVIPSKVTSMGDNVFYNCSGLVSITIPSTVTSIGESAFEGCTNLQSVTFEGNSQLQSIGKLAFYNCSSLTAIVIPSTVTSMSYNVFYGCSNLTIYCEAEEQPSTWHSNWNPSACPVEWGYKQQ